MKKEAINTFSEGLITDLNPLTTPNNVMTSCLNGTLITYNGNEFVLQTDMGNGRVESAYLPSGYVPVGIKESGGIIYVASYNPITGKGQIGSFPSPERNIESEELSNSITELDMQNFERNLIQRIKIFGEDQIIRSGDKFSIILDADTIRDDMGEQIPLNKLLSNYQNTIIENGTEIVKSFKNKLITLQVAVLDKNNNLQDITKTLKRFDQTTNLEVSDAYLLDNSILENKEYFTQKYQPNDNIEFYRNKKARNVFNSKLSGNLCIIAKLNTLEQFDVAVECKKILIAGVPSVRITLTSIYRYNCPDGCFNETQKYGYKDDYEPSSTLYGYKANFNNNIFEGTAAQQNVVYDSSQADLNTSSIFYNPETNLYELKTITTHNLMQAEGILNYEITPKSIVGLLSGLARRGQVNLDKLQTGEVLLNEWRYKKEDTKITLKWGLEVYPRENETFDGFKFELYDITKPEIVAYTYNIDGEINSSRSSTEELENIPQSSNKNKNALYLVKITYNSSIDGERILAYRWLYNTGLYNEAYTQDRILDFDMASDDLKQYRNIQIQCDATIDYDRQENVQGDYNNQQYNNIKIVSRPTTREFTINKTTVTKKITNTEKLPFSIELGYIEKTGIDTNKKNVGFDDTTIQGDLSNTYITSSNTINSDFQLSYYSASNKIKASCTAKLAYQPKPVVIQIAKPFTPIIDSAEDYFGEVDISSLEAKRYVGLMAYSKDVSGSNDYHELRINNNVNKYSQVTDVWNGAEIIAQRNDTKGAVAFAPTSQPNTVLYNQNAICNNIKNTKQIISIIKQFPRNAYAVGSDLEGKVSFKFYDSIQVSGGKLTSFSFFNDRYTTNFEIAFWQDENGNPKMINLLHAKQNEGIEKFLFNKFNSTYLYTETYKNQSFRSDRLDRNDATSYVYNDTTDIQFNLPIEIQLSNISLGGGFDYFNFCVQFCLNAHPEANYNELYKNTVFTYPNTITINKNLPETLTLNSMYLKFSELSDSTVDTAIVLKMGSGYELITKDGNQDLNWDASQAYMKLSTGHYAPTASYEKVNYADFFVEKNGKFFVKSSTVKPVNRIIGVFVQAFYGSDIEALTIVKLNGFDAVSTGLKGGTGTFLSNNCLQLTE